MSASQVSLYAEDFSDRDGKPRLVGEFATAWEARFAAESRIREDLGEYDREGQDTEDQFRQWMMFGEDLFLLPDDSLTPFSAVDYARQFLGIPPKQNRAS